MPIPVRPISAAHEARWSGEFAGRCEAPGFNMAFEELVGNSIEAFAEYRSFCFQSRLCDGMRIDTEIDIPLPCACQFARVC